MAVGRLRTIIVKLCRVFGRSLIPQALPTRVGSFLSSRQQKRRVQRASISRRTIIGVLTPRRRNASNGAIIIIKLKDIVNSNMFTIANYVLCQCIV
jgi:hypothetical protein